MTKKDDLSQIQLEIENYYSKLSNDKKILNEYFDIVDLERHSQLYYKVFFSKMSFDTDILFIGINPGGGEPWSSPNAKEKFEYVEYDYQLARETKTVFKLANYTNLLEILNNNNKVVKTNLYYLVTNNKNQLEYFTEKILDENQRKEFSENHKSWTSRIIELCKPKIIIYEGEYAYNNSPPYYYNTEKLVDYNQDGIYLVKLKDYKSTLIGYNRILSAIKNKESLAKILEKEFDSIPTLKIHKDLIN